MQWPADVPLELQRFATGTQLDLVDCRRINLGSEEAARGVQLDPDDAGMGAPPHFSDATPPNWVVDLKSSEGEQYTVYQRGLRTLQNPQSKDAQSELERFTQHAPYRLKKLAAILHEAGYRLLHWSRPGKRDRRHLLEFQSASGEVFEIATSTLR